MLSLLAGSGSKGSPTFSTSAKQGATPAPSSDLGQVKSPGNRDRGCMAPGVKDVLCLDHTLGGGSERRALDPDKDIEWLYLM
jgi:hypothetical protein